MELDTVFPRASVIAKKMELEESYKDFTYETLCQPGFQEAVTEAFPFIDWDKPFDEFIAARERKKNL